jgi:hypothetical protein
MMIINSTPSGSSELIATFSFLSFFSPFELFLEDGIETCATEDADKGARMGMLPIFPLGGGIDESTMGPAGEAKDTAALAAAKARSLLTILTQMMWS